MSILWERLKWHQVAIYIIVLDKFRLYGLLSLYRCHCVWWSQTIMVKKVKFNSLSLNDELHQAIDFKDTNALNKTTDQYFFPFKMVSSDSFLHEYRWHYRRFHHLGSIKTFRKYEHNLTSSYLDVFIRRMKWLRRETHNVCWLV